jgi:hypothetical protein
MIRDFGATLLIIGVVLLLLACGYFVKEAPCDPAVQHCLVEQQVQAPAESERRQP